MRIKQHEGRQVNISPFEAVAIHFAAVIDVVLLAAAILVGVQDADVRAVAATPGEPQIVGAAGFGRDGAPLWSIENPFAFDPLERRRRVVVVGRAGGGDAPARAVLDVVRWFKSVAPSAVRERWLLSALPVADLDNPHVRRWVDFQAADLRVEVAEGSAAAAMSVAGPLATDSAVAGSLRSITTSPASAVDAVRRALASGGAERSTLHDAIVQRAARTPLDIGRVLASRYPQTPSISYIPAVAWTNALLVAGITGDPALRAKVIEQVRPWLTGEKPLFGTPVLLTAIAGTMIFADLARGDPASPAAARATEGATLASAMTENGIALYGQGWTDDMFMASAILARTGRTNDRAGDLDTAAQLLIRYAERLQRSDGIFVHATDGPFAWGRGNGFAAFGLTEVLTAMPSSHQLRPRILEIYRRQMSALKGVQSPDGTWRQVLDEPGAYREETVTAMVVTAMARGIRLGWLERSYSETVRRGWRALAVRVGHDGSLVDVCAGTGAGPTRQYYLDRPAITGFDDRGGAMALAASMEMEQSRDLPTVAAQGIHQADGALDQLARFVDFLDRFGAVGARRDDAIAARGAIVQDFDPELLAVAIEEPNHRNVGRIQRMPDVVERRILLVKSSPSLQFAR
jgi:unsaturated rhamnogalacturonyl hydrolase